MKHISVILIIVVVAIFGCKHKNEMLTITINISNPDTCFELSAGDSVLYRRDIEILENTLSDTIGLGFAVVYPRETGKHPYLRDGNELLYLVTPSDIEDQPPIRTICFDAHQKKPAHGTITLRLKRHY
jgi:hypothetical protein